MQAAKELEVEARQNKIWSLFVQGFTQSQIAKKLDVSLKTVSRDFKELKTKSMEWMDTLPEGELQIHHKKNVESIEKVIQELWSLYEKTKNEDKKISILHQITNKSLLHSQLMSEDNLLAMRKFTQRELKHKQLYGDYSNKRISAIDKTIRANEMSLNKTKIEEEHDVSKN